MGPLLIHCGKCDYYFKVLREERQPEYEIFDLDFNNSLVLTALCDKCNEYTTVEEKDFRSRALAYQCPNADCFGLCSLEDKTWEKDRIVKVSFQFRCNECGGKTLFHYPSV